MSESMDAAATSAKAAAATFEDAASRIKSAQDRVDAATLLALDKSRVDLMAVYQARLNHEYDKGWEQIRITAYVSAGILAATGLLLRGVSISDPALLLRAVFLLGFAVALGSLINQIGSQLSARALRKTLGTLEAGAAT